jgi:enoyl-CoA hydratase
MPPGQFDRAANLATEYSPDTAVAAGLLDEVVAPSDVAAAAHEAAAAFAKLDRGAHVATKERTRAALVAGVRAGLGEYD